MNGASACVCRRGGEEAACLLNHTRYHPSIHLPTHLFLLHLFLVGGGGSKDCPRVLTPSHIRRRTPPRCVTTNLPLPIAPACSCIYLHLRFSRPLALSLSLSLSVHPPLLVLYVPPTPCVTAVGEERKMLPPTKVKETTVRRVKGSGSWRVFSAHRCLHPP